MHQPSPAPARAAESSGEPFGPPPPSIQGYTTTLSVAQGERVGLAVSTRAKAFSVEVGRLGERFEKVWTGEGIRGEEYPIPPRASSDGCQWPVAITIPVDAGWRPGYYLVKLRTEGSVDGSSRSEADAYFIVRNAHPGRGARILLQLSTNTYNAYNNWGGYSLYAYNAVDKAQGRRVSFDRPGGSQYETWERVFVAWAERSGYAIDFAANSDLEIRPEILKSYPLVLSVGHDEYWSTPMRDSLESYIASGGNVAFFSGNSVCWQVRTERDGRALDCWKQSFGDDPVYWSRDRRTLSTLWSHHLVARPENTLTGVGFLWGGYHKSHGQYMDGSGAYRVHRPEHWAFEGTGVSRDREIGGKHTVVGYECDGCELFWKDGLPEATHRDGTPPGFVVMATAPARWHPDDSAWYERWDLGREGRAVMGSYNRGGTVFTVGSTDWAHGLRGGDPVIERITRNVVDRLSR